MANKHVEISSEAIRKALNKYRPEQAIAEFIWNGFDAKATRVEINYKERHNSLGLIESICIEDNGEGIIHEELDLKFKKFNESQKAKKKKRSYDLTKGKNGRIRSKANVCHGRYHCRRKRFAKRDRP